MVKMREKQEVILRYFRLSHSPRKISRDLRLNRKTVKRYIVSYREKIEKIGGEVGDVLSIKHIHSNIFTTSAIL